MALAQRNEEKYGREDQAYFSYYAMLTHQAQMLQDGVRTGAYQNAILSHPEDFAGASMLTDHQPPFEEAGRAFPWKGAP